MNNNRGNSSKQGFRAWLSPYYQSFKRYFGKFWHRYQLTRWLIVIVLALVFVVSATLTFQAKTANVGNLKAQLEKTTYIYDKSNHKAGSLYAQKGTYVPLSKISPNVQKAVISTEDRNFYHEHGFSVKGIARAFYLLAKNKLLHRDYISGGGSTLTQQLVKNAFLTQEQTMTRKLKEIFLAIEVENVYSGRIFFPCIWITPTLAMAWGVQGQRPINTLNECELNGSPPLSHKPFWRECRRHQVVNTESTEQRRLLNVVLGLTDGAITKSLGSKLSANSLATADTYQYKIWKMLLHILLWCGDRRSQFPNKG